MALAGRFAKNLKAGDIICLKGELGAGKTTFTKGLAQALRVNAADVNSPTFILMNYYDGKLPVYHFDFYRLEQLEEIEKIGYEEFLYGDGVTVIEWAERLQHLFPTENLTVHLRYKAEHERTLEIVAHGQRYEQLLAEMRKRK